MTPRIIELSELQERLWDAFEGAEKKYMPSGLNPVRVTKEFVQLCQAGHLRFYEYYPLYWSAAIACSALAFFGSQPALFLGFLGFLVTGVQFGRRHVRLFAYQMTKVMGLERFSFGVPQLPLLVHGMICLLDEWKTESGARAALLTKSRLASIIKLVKVGHEHGEVQYGFSDQLKKGVYAAVGAAITAAYAHRAEVDKGVLEVRQAIAGSWALSGMAIILLVGLGMVLHGLFVSEIKEKRRRRRYLLVLNVIHETWHDEQTLDRRDVPRDASHGAQGDAGGGCSSRPRRVHGAARCRTLASA